MLAPSTRRMTRQLLPVFLLALSSQTLHAGVISFDATDQANSAFYTLLNDVPVGGWAQLSSNSFSDVYTPNHLRARGVDGTQSRTNPERVIAAWSSMAWDPNRNDLIFWGGGHANYTGNEVYRWSSATLSWERASLPSQIQLQNPSLSAARYETVDGWENSPISTHTYDSTEFLPIADRLSVIGGPAYNSGGPFLKDDLQTVTGPYFWDPDKADPNKVGGITGSGVNPATEGGEMWQNRDNLPQQFNWKTLNNATAWTEENGKDVLFFHVPQFKPMKYTIHDVNDPSQDTWEEVGERYDQNVRLFNKQGSGAYDSTRNWFVRTNASTLLFWDLNTFSNAISLDLNSLIAGSPITDLHGMDYDPIIDKYLLWGGNSSVWYLTPPDNKFGTWDLEEIVGIGDAPIGQWAGRGILGKWKYLADYGVFLGVNGFDVGGGDIWAYKPVGHDLLVYQAPALGAVPLADALWHLLIGLSIMRLIGIRKAKS